MLSPVLVMTLFDVLIVGAAGFACWSHYKHRRLISGGVVGLGSILVTLGVVVIGLFYTADFLMMHIFPVFVPTADAFGFMKALHLDYMWFVNLLGIGSIVVGFAITIANIAALIEESRQRHSRFRDVAEVASDWVWEMDEQLRFTYLSNRFFENIPIPSDQIIGKSRAQSAGGITDNEAWRQHMDNLAKRRTFRNFEYTVFLPNGGTRQVLINGKPIFDAGGTFKGYRGTGTDKTAEFEARKALEESEKQFRNLIEGSIQGLYIHKDWKFLFANQALADIFGYQTIEEILALGTMEPLLAPEERERLWAYKVARQNGEYAPEIYEARGIRNDGSEIWLEFRVKSIDWRGISAMQCVVVDITERRKAEKARQEQNERFNAALENMSEGVCMFDGEQRIIVCNQRYASMYNLSPEQVKPGTTLNEIFALRITSGIYANTDLETYKKEWQEWVDGGADSYKVTELSDGRVIGITHQPMPDGGWLTSHADITEFRSIEQQLSHLAHHDALTELPNRVLLRERMDEALKRPRQANGFSLLCLDLDGFKGINDTLGHPAGDELLKAVAERLRGCVREIDTVARLGGDEFAIIQTSIDQPEDTMVLASRICELVAAPFTLGDHEVVVGTSIGIAVAPKDAADPDELMKKADMALYQAKADGRGRHRFFRPEMEAGTKDRHSLGLDLRKALANGELALHYQPLINLGTNRVSGFEALLRWRHRERGMVAPNDFIPIAEELGLINQIGEWVLLQACSEAATWPGDITVAVNISPVQFRGGQLVAIVSNALAESGLEANRLELEITERVLLHEEEATLAALHQLHGLGVRISLDNFGTGYTALSYLRSFPFDKIKIDASFIGDHAPGEDDLGIVHAIVTMACKLGAVTTAEGVETEEQLAIVRDEGCTEAQGYLFSPPCPPHELHRLIRQPHRKTESAA